MTAEDRHLALSFAQKPLTLVRGSGYELEDDAGRRIVDLGGASHGVANFGHAHPRIAAAVAAQAARLVHVVGTVRSPERALFLERLHALLPAHLTRSYLVNSGTEAVEAALKHAAAATGRTRFVAARGGFHGRTLGALHVTHRAAYRQPFAGLLHQATFVPYGDLGALEQALAGDDVAAVILEPVQGEGGVRVAPPGYLAGAADRAHARGALLVVDEIQTGLGRTGYDLALLADRGGSEPGQNRVAADLLCLGKSLAGGLPIGVAAMTEAVARAMPAGAHGSTFGGGPLVASAAAEALDVLREEKLSERARSTGEAWLARLRAIPSPLVREVRGRGLMIGVELRIKSDPVLKALLERGYLALPAGPTVVRFLPPLGIAADVCARAADALAAILADPALAPRPGGSAERAR